MERKFKAVAMRFTQEAFDGMDKSGMEIVQVFDFESSPYLVNNYRGNKLMVTNLDGQALKFNDRTAIETCDPKLFRQYCGLENPVEDELKDAISKNKRGFYFLFLDPVEEKKEKRMKELKEAIWQKPLSFGEMGIRQDEEPSDFEKQLKALEKAKTNQSCIQNMIELEKNLFSAMDVPNLLKEEYRKNPNEANFKKSLKAIAEHHKRNNKSYNLIKELEKNQETFQSKDLQYFHEGYQKWTDFWHYDPNTKLRFKPNPTKTLDTEIEALNQKAKEMGFKAVITFESL